MIRKFKPLHIWLVSEKERYLWRKTLEKSAKIPQISSESTKEYADFVWEAFPEETTGGPEFFSNLKTYGYSAEDNQWLEIIFGEPKQLPAPYYAVFHDAEVIGQNGIHVHRNGKVIVEACLGQLEYFHRSMDHQYFFQLNKYPIQEGPEAAIVLFNKLSQNFYHFYLETLPRLQFLEKFTAETGIRPHILLPENPPAFVKPLLSFYFNLNDDRLYTYKPGRMRVKTLILPSYSFLRNRDLLWQTLKHPQWYRFFNQHPAVHHLPEMPPIDVLVVSRKNATARRLINSDVLAQVLAPAHVQIVSLEEESLMQQIAFFRRAKVAIMPHGAGLSHMVTSSKCTFIELYPKSRFRVNADFYALAASLNIPHHVICCPSVGDEEDLELTPEVLQIIQQICTSLIHT